MKRYEWLAAEIERLVQQGVIRAGERVPSVRKASSQFGVSLSTVLKTYQVLEQRGLLLPRPQSGYYVRQNNHNKLAEPRRSSPSSSPRKVDINDLIFEVFGAIQDRSVLALGSGFPSPDLYPMRKFNRRVARFLRTVDPWVTVRDLPPGDPLLIQRIAQRYLERGYQVPPEEIVITSGALEALNLCIDTITQPGDTVAIESPATHIYLQVIQRRGLRAVEIGMDPDEGLNLDKLEQAIHRHKLKAVLLMTTFQNPLGCCMPDAKKRALVELLARHAIPLIEDDVYTELAFDGVHRKAAKAYDRRGLVLHCSSFTKWLSAGRRVGWASAGRYAKQVRELKLITSLSAPPYAQAAIYEYLVHGPMARDLRELRQTLHQNLHAMQEAIGAHFPADTRVSRPEGGYVLWVELSKAADVMQLYRKALLENISIAPGPMFSASRGFGNCMRLNFGLKWDERMQTGVRRVGELAKRQLSRKAA